MAAHKLYEKMSVEDVVKLINDGQLHVHPLRPKDQLTRPGVHWELFHALYDVNQEVVPKFFFCPMCYLLLRVDTKTQGTNPLTRHACFKVQQAAKEPTQTEKTKRCT